MGPHGDIAFRTVDDPVAGRLLSDPESLSFLEPFLARESSISAAAEALDRPLDAVRYRVKRFLAAGLVEVVREVPRAGRAIRIYRSVADGFVLPFHVTPYADLEERLRASLGSDVEKVARATARALREEGVEGRRIYRGTDGNVHQVAALPERWRPSPHQAVEAFSREVELTPARARKLLADLYALVVDLGGENDAEGGDGDGGERTSRTYHVAFQIAPIE